MAKEFECHFEGCHATIQAETEQEVLSLVENHANRSHTRLELDDNAIENIRANIVDV